MGSKIEYGNSTFTILDKTNKQVVKPIRILITRLDNLIEDGKVKAFREGRSYGITLEIHNTYKGDYDVYSGMVCKNDFMISNQPKKYNGNHSLKSKIIYSLENRTTYLNLPLLYIKSLSKVPSTTIENNRTYNLTEELKNDILEIIIKTIEDIDNADTVNDKGIFITLHNTQTKKVNIGTSTTHTIETLLKYESILAPQYTYVKSTIENALSGIKEHDDWTSKTLSRLKEQYANLDLKEFTKKNIGKIVVRLPNKKKGV